ncbi:MAG: hypothetical protein ACK4RT_02165 [Erythrobacter sp.]
MMGETTMNLADEATAEAVLRAELARETRALGSVVPVLRHLLASEGQRLVSDAVLARVRGMLGDLAAQLFAAGHTGPPEALIESLAADPGLLVFCHALAAESQLCERLHQQRGLDPVLSPLLQELIASDIPAIAELAMNTLAAQSRFVQTQRRMQLPLAELPAELFAAVLRAGGNPAACAVLQQSYDEGASRLGLLARLVAAMRRGAVAALALDHAGPSLFASALATLASQTRETAVLACHEGQGVRLALALRTAGLTPEAIERQFLTLHPAAPMPRELAALSPERARLLLGAAGVD